MRLFIILFLFCLHSPDFGEAFGSHGVNLELWLNVDGYSVESFIKDPKFPYTPDIRTLSHNFREPPELGESYASRMYAWFAPSVTGNYQFLICMYISYKVTMLSLFYLIYSIL